MYIIENVRHGQSLVLPMLVNKSIKWAEETVKSLYAYWQHRAMVQRTKKELLSLTPAQLDDIGITRYDIDEILRSL